MKKSGSLWKAILWFVFGLLLGYVFGAKSFVTKEAGATILPNGDGWHDITECVAPICGTDEGFKTQERITYSYADPICPTWYHVQNSGNWNQRCHRDYHWQQPEHKAPIGCPKDYDRDGVSCKKTTTENREVKCEAPIVECEQEPTPTPEPPVVIDRGTGVASPPQEPTCKDLGGYAPTITKVGRIDKDTVFAEWTSPSENADSYLVWYGLKADKLEWNTIVKGLRAEISGKELTGHVWFKVAAKSEGCVGNFSITTDP